MLVVTRRANESVVINDDIVVKVLEIRGDHVRIGIDAPRSVAVHREEVYRELAASNRAAASPPAERIETLRSLGRDGRPRQGE